MRQWLPGSSRPKTWADRYLAGSKALTDVIAPPAERWIRYALSVKAGVPVCQSWGSPRSASSPAVFPDGYR